MTDHFAKFHPITCFCYFAVILGFSMVYLHPVFLLLSGAGGFLYALMQRGRTALRFTLGGLLPLLVFSVVINAAFNHKGATILTYLPGGNPLTAESIWFGLCAAAMFVTVIGWCTCLTPALGTDKLICLFGRLLPSLSLLFSMTLGFLPRCRRQFSAIYTAQKQLLPGTNSRRQKLRLGLQSLSILLTYVLETSIDTADSMHARGFGTRRRTAYSTFRFRPADIILLTGTLSAAAFLIYSHAVWGDFVTFFPLFRLRQNPAFLFTAAVYGILCFLPAAINLLEETKWNRLKSNI